MKIIGYQTKGNAIRFYLGSYDLTPKYNKNDLYDHSVAPGIYPYSDFVAGWKDVYVAWDKTAFSCQGDSIEAIRQHFEPLIVIVESPCGDSAAAFNYYKGAKDAVLYYLDDEMEPDEIGLPDNYPGKSIDE